MNANALRIEHGSVAALPAPVTCFSSLSIHFKPINKCGISFTVGVQRLIFIKKQRNGHHFATWGPKLRYDSDDKHTWQTNFVLATFFFLMLWIRGTFVHKYFYSYITCSISFVIYFVISCMSHHITTKMQGDSWVIVMFMFMRGEKNTMDLSFEHLQCFYALIRYPPEHVLDTFFLDELRIALCGSDCDFISSY